MKSEVTDADRRPFTLRVIVTLLNREVKQNVVHDLTIALWMLFREIAEGHDARNPDSDVTMP